MTKFTSTSISFVPALLFSNESYEKFTDIAILNQLHDVEALEEATNDFHIACSNVENKSSFLKILSAMDSISDDSQSVIDFKNAIAIEITISNEIVVKAIYDNHDIIFIKYDDKNDFVRTYDTNFEEIELTRSFKFKHATSTVSKTVDQSFLAYLIYATNEVDDILYASIDKKFIDNYRSPHVVSNANSAHVMYHECMLYDAEYDTMLFGDQFILVYDEEEAVRSTTLTELMYHTAKTYKAAI